MKAIILAGGLGTRLGKYTKDLPKCMLNFAGESLIERQIKTFKKCGIENIIVVRKHLANKINMTDVTYIDETDYDTHMVVGLFQAKKEFNDDIIISYGDIIFEEGILNELIQSKGEVCIVGDEDWKDYWIARIGSFTKDSESYVIGEDNKMISLGIENPEIKDMHARYIGMIKFSKSALNKIERIYDNAVKESWEKPWHTSKSFKKAYMTDFMQELIDKGLDVRAVKIKRGWMEFDTIDDYELACKWLKQGNLGRFFNINNGNT
jgi:L-glutamine-phosphate cytidylyltransferase